MPGTAIHVDLIGLLTTTSSMNKYIFAAIDKGSKLAVVEALHDRLSRTVAKCLFSRVYCQLGFYPVVMTDRGS